MIARSVTEVLVQVFAAACERSHRAQANDGINLDKKFECTDEELHACVGTLMRNLVIFFESPDVEVKERAFTAHQLLLSIDLPRDLTLATSASVASKCRLASRMLTYLLVPEPMKPISAKTQKRKHAEGPPSPISFQEWEKDVDWDAFWFLNEETQWFDREGNAKGSAESICFTKQHPNTAMINLSGVIAKAAVKNHIVRKLTSLNQPSNVVVLRVNFPANMGSASCYY